MMPPLRLPALFETVRHILIERDQGTMSVTWGARESGKQVNQGLGRANRVIFKPGKAKKIGKYEPARRPGGNPRTLFRLRELAEIRIWAADTTAPNDELAQYKAVMALHGQVVRALYHAGHGTFTLEDPEWVTKDIERPFGMEMTVTLSIDHPLYDATNDEVYATAETENFLNETPDGTDVHVGAGE